MTCSYIKSRCDAILAAIVASPMGLSSGDLSKQFGLTKDYVGDQLGFLRQLGKIDYVGRGQKRVWVDTARAPQVQAAIEEGYIARLMAERFITREAALKRMTRRKEKSTARTERRRRAAEMEHDDGQPLRIIVPANEARFVKTGPASVWELAA